MEKAGVEPATASKRLPSAFLPCWAESTAQIDMLNTYDRPKGNDHSAIFPSAVFPAANMALDVSVRYVYSHSHTSCALRQGLGGRVEREGIEPPLCAYETQRLPLSYLSPKERLPSHIRIPNN